MIAACKHGQLARSCEICDLEQQLAAAPDMLAALKAVQASRPGTLIVSYFVLFFVQLPCSST